MNSRTRILTRVLPTIIAGIALLYFTAIFCSNVKRDYAQRESISSILQTYIMLEKIRNFNELLRFEISVPQDEKSNQAITSDTTRTLLKGCSAVRVAAQAGGDSAYPAVVRYTAETAKTCAALASLISKDKLTISALTAFSEKQALGYQVADEGVAAEKKRRTALDAENEKRERPGTIAALQQWSVSANSAVKSDAESKQVAQ